MTAQFFSPIRPTSKVNPVEEIMRITDGRGVDVAIEALGTQVTFESSLAPGSAAAVKGQLGAD